MRLGQLSRKIGIQPSRISAFLEGESYTLEAGSNSKLTEEQEELVKTHFDYVEEEDAVASDTIHNDTPVADTSQKESLEDEEETSESDSEEVIEKEENTAVADILHVDTTVADIINADAKAIDTIETDEDEVIRAPKLKLEGLKVVGKIELPEPKTPTVVDNSEALSEEVNEKPIRKRLNNYKANRRPKKGALTLEEKRDREERAKKRKNKKAKADQKQIKAAHYESKMREWELSPSKKSKRKTIKNEEPNIGSTTAPVPKTLFGKFMRWLNT